MFSALNYCGGIFFKSLSYIGSGAHKLFRRFLDFLAIFDRNFAKTMAPPSNKNENYVVLLKEQSILKKVLKTSSKSTHKRSHNTCLNYVPHVQADQAWHTKNTNFRSYSQRVWFISPNFACW